MAKSNLYKQVMKEAEGLRKDLQQLAIQYIYSGLTDGELLSILIKKKDTLVLPTFNAELLKNEAVLIQTAKVLGLMEISVSPKDFETLVNKLKDKQKLNRPNVDFDATIKRLLQIKKEQN